MENYASIAPQEVGLFPSSQHPSLDRASIELFHYAVHISNKYKYIYCECPKVACSTIKRMLINAELEHAGRFRSSASVHERQLSPLCSPQQFGGLDDISKSDYFKFCFVRDPYSRLLSCYLNKIVPGTIQYTLISSALGLRSESCYGISFSGFVAALEAQRVIEIDPHWRPQKKNLLVDFIKYDFVGRFECLGSDLASASNKVGIDFNKYYISDRDHRTDAGDMLSSYYTPLLKAKVARLYSDDFELFGYAK